MRRTSWHSLAVALALVIGAPTLVAASPSLPAAGETGAAPDAAITDWSAKKGDKKFKRVKFKHLKIKRAKSRGHYRARFAHPRRAHYRPAFHRRGHWHCHRHFRIRHCHWHRPRHHR